MKIYYAHTLNIYNTPQEKRDVQLLEKMGFEVINPNSKETQVAYKEKEDWDVFNRLIDGSDYVAFRALPDGSIGSGVYKELEYAQGMGKYIIEIPSGLKRRALTLDQTREYLTEIGQR